MLVRIFLVGFLLIPAPLCAAEGPAEPLRVAPVSALPFALLLGCIAILPLIPRTAHWWHLNRNKLIVSLGLAVPVAVYLLTLSEASHGRSTHELLHELKSYVSFIVLLGALYTIAGGIYVDADLAGRPRTNTSILAIGAVLANLIGTTGASMVLIRVLLHTNVERHRVAHIPIFFIFVVSNTGGLLTPLGDPPLFLGFLAGVDFFWTMGLWKHWLLVNGLLLAIFYVWDTLAWRRETSVDKQQDERQVVPVRVRGLKVNLPLIVGVLLAVILQSDKTAASLGIPALSFPVAEAIMVLLAVLSMVLTPKNIRHRNRFSWGPILEVAALFIGIFVAMVPALALLNQYRDSIGVTTPAQYFWLTGGLSAFLDNAPTYVTFGKLAAGSETIGALSLSRPDLLAAISCGAVFMGAGTYIGNGPNFMVKAIAEQSNYKMPSFLGYLLYSAGVLIPVMLVATLVFFRS